MNLQGITNCMSHGSLSRKALLIFTSPLSTIVLTAEEASLLALEYNVNPVVGSTESLFDLTSQYVSFKSSHSIIPESLFKI